LATKKIWKNNMDNIVVYKYKWKCYENTKLMSTFSQSLKKSCQKTQSIKNRNIYRKIICYYAVLDSHPLEIVKKKKKKKKKKRS